GLRTNGDLPMAPVMSTTATHPLRRRLTDGIIAADRFVRLHFLFFTALWPVLGAASVRQSFTKSELAGLLAVICGFHVYAFVLNDVVDLPIDRTNPERRQDPLVRGAIPRGSALTIALLQPVLTAGITMWVGGSVRAQATLLACYAFMGAYNVWGKRCP